MREIVTVQAGEEANWVGAYLWALKEQRHAEAGAGGEEDTWAAASVFYETTGGSGAREPRALLFDTPEAFDPFRAAEHGAEEEEEGAGNGPAARAAALTWRGGVDVHVHREEQPISVVVGEAAVPRTWAEAWQGLHSWPQLARHCVGHGGGAGASGWGDASGGDQLRRLMEGCDGPQGAHVLVDLSGPWLDYGVGAAQEWAEEVGGGGMVCLALHRPAAASGPARRADDAWRLVEAAVGVHKLLETGGLLLPLGIDREEQRARQAVGLAAASGVYARARGCHMREWVQGVRMGSNTGVASLELGFPFPPPDRLTEPLSTILQPTDPRAALTGAAPPASGLLSHLVSLAPGPPPAGPHQQPQPPALRRISGIVSLYHHGGAVDDGLVALNDAAKYYPWFQPYLNYAEPRPFPVRRWPFPVAWRATAAEAEGAEEVDGEEHGATGYGALAMVGCTSATLPFLHELSGALRGRGPGVRARLREEKGWLDEDVAEVEEALEALWAPFEEPEEAARGK